MRLSGRAAVVGALGLVWLVLAVAGGFRGAGLLASLAALLLGGVVTVAWPRAGEAVRRVVEQAEAWLGSGPTPEVVPEAEPDVARAAVEDVLSTLAEELGGRRMTVWRVDRYDDVVEPAHTLGDPPARQRASGNPLAWAVEGRSAMRLDPAPAWSRGDVVVAPIDEHRVLSVEAPPGRAPAPDRLAPGARILAALLSLADRETDALAERERLRRVVEFLQGLSREADPGLAPDALARAAIDLMDARGAVVASWADDRGVILVRHGRGGGPAAGREFGPGDGDLAHAARVGVPIRRSPADPGATPPLVDGREGWERPPPYRVVVPLLLPDGAVAGMVAAWGDRPADPGVRLLEALGPLLGLQLRRATDLVRFRDRATVDTLTGLANRAAFDERLEEERARFHRYRRPVALMVIDLDRFKHVNDTWGHPAGDTVLRRVAEVVADAVRDVDIAARYGGEELVVLMAETMLYAARDVAERVRAAIADTEMRHDGTIIPVTASIGVSSCPELVDDPIHLFDSADVALYRAKQAGRNRVETDT